MSGDVTL